MRVVEIDIDELYISDQNIRSDHQFGDEEDLELIENIQSLGILQPLVVRPKGNKYDIIIGRRRFLSLKQSGVKSVPCLVAELSDEEALDASISENVFRKSVDPITLGRWIKIRLNHNINLRVIILTELYLRKDWEFALQF